MEENTHTVECRYCKSPIDIKVKRCPNCRSWQKWFFNIDRANTLINGVIIAFFIALGIIGVFSSMEYFWGNNEDENIRFSPEDKRKPSFSELEIEKSNMTFYKCGFSECVVLLLTVKNSTDFTWEDISFYVRFFNKSGRLIDVHTFEAWSFFVPENSSRSLRHSFSRIADQEEYHSMNIEIQNADESKI